MSPFLNKSRHLSEFATYTPILKFILVDKDKRLFLPERYCFRGSIDDWIIIGQADVLNELLNKFAKHIGHESFYELI
jgi:hypothetical protein